MGTAVSFPSSELCQLRCLRRDQCSISTWSRAHLRPEHFPFCSLTARTRPCHQPPPQQSPDMMPLLIVFVFLIFWDPMLTGKVEIFLGDPFQRRAIPLSKPIHALPPWTLQFSKQKKYRTALMSARSELASWLSNLLAVLLQAKA